MKGAFVPFLEPPEAHVGCEALARPEQGNAHVDDRRWKLEGGVGFGLLLPLVLLFLHQLFHLGRPGLEVLLVNEQPVIRGNEAYVPALNPSLVPDFQVPRRHNPCIQLGRGLKALTKVGRLRVLQVRVI
jgi:hypothetical protein